MPIFSAPKWFLLVLPMLVVGGIHAQSPDAKHPVAPSPDQSWNLAPRWKPGQTTRYQTQTSFDLTFGSDEKSRVDTVYQFGTDATLRYTVKKIDSDGNLMLSATSDGGKITDISGQQREVPKEATNYPRTITLNRWGTLQKLEDEGKNGKAANPLESVFDLTNLLVQLHFLAFPDKPVKAGDEWTAHYPLPSLGKSDKEAKDPKSKDKAKEAVQTINASYRLVGAAKIGELDAVKIEQEATVPYSAMTDAFGNLTLEPEKKSGGLTLTLVFRMTAYVLPETGQVLQTSGNVEGDMKLEGTLTKQLPGEHVKFVGKLIALRLANKPLESK